MCMEIRVDMFVNAVASHVWEKTMLDGTIGVGPYMIVCIFGSCAANCNQELVQAIVAQVVSRCSRFADVVGNYKNPSGPVVGGA